MHPAITSPFFFRSTHCFSPPLLWITLNCAGCRPESLPLFLGLDVIAVYARSPLRGFLFLEFLAANDFSMVARDSICGREDIYGSLSEDQFGTRLNSPPAISCVFLWIFFRLLLPVFVIMTFFSPRVSPLYLDVPYRKTFLALCRLAQPLRAGPCAPKEFRRPQGTYPDFPHRPETPTRGVLRVRYPTFLFPSPPVCCCLLYPGNECFRVHGPQFFVVRFTFLRGFLNDFYCLPYV